MLFDLPLEQLYTYLPARIEPADFDMFWQQTLAETRQHPLNAVFTPVDLGLKLIESWDVTFNGYGGQPIKGWLHLPRHYPTPLGCVVEFIGYGGGRGLPIDWLLWSNAGYAHLVMDTRGQGSSWRQGDTGDLPTDGANPHYPGFMTQGILSPATYYYRRVFADGVRAVETALSHPAVDGERLAVLGGSQGVVWRWRSPGWSRWSKCACLMCRSSVIIAERRRSPHPFLMKRFRLTVKFIGTR
jgi:cephalosporin-C deacetylase